MANLTLIPSAKVPLVYEGENTMTTEWYRFFWNIYGFTGSGVVPVNKGGTGLDTIGDHQVIIGNANNVFEPAIFTGSGINITYTPGVINLAIGASGISPGTYGSASQVGVFTVNQYGILTGASNTTIAINASQIISGTIDPARISGSYTGITGVGTLTVGTWNANTIAAGYGGTGQSSYAIGDILYATGTTALSKLNIGANTYVLASTGTAPHWVAPSTVVIGTATNLAGGTANQIPYQTGPGATSFIAAPTTADTYLNWSGTAFQWSANPLGTVTNVSALTLGTTGTDLSSTVANSTTTPVITLNVPTASATNRGALSAADWTTFNSKANAFTYTTNYIPYGQGTTTPAQSSALQFNGTTLSTTYDASIAGITAGIGAGASTSNTVFGAGAFVANSSGVNCVAIGYTALAANTTAFNNVAVGWQALKSNTTGVQNVAVGTNAMNANISGSQNVGVGSAALNALVSGNYNCAFGFQSANGILTGNNNVFAGYQSGGVNYGSDNVCLGYQSGTKLAPNNNNTSVGSGALQTQGASVVATTIVAGLSYTIESIGTTDFTLIGAASNTVGISFTATGVGTGTGRVNVNISGSVAIGYKAANAENRYPITAIGNNAALNISTGQGITAIGYEALKTGNSNFNTAVGYQTNYSNTSGGSNASLGYQALYLNTNGANNVAIGYQAGYLNISGGGNVFVGSLAGYGSTGTELTVIGYNALQSNTGNYGSSFGHKSLYSNTSGSNNAFGHSALYSNLTGSSNSAFGGFDGSFNAALYANTSGDRNCAFGVGALTANTTSSYSTAMGWSAGYASTGAANTFFGYNAGSAITSGSKHTLIGVYSGNSAALDIRTANNYVVLSDGDGNIKATWNDVGSFGVGTTPAYGTSGQVLTSQGSGAAPIWTTPAAGTVTSVTGTSPVVSSGGATPAISLATAYGDTLNPYASKTANYFLAAPNGSAGVPTFRAMVAADVPALAYVTSVSGTGTVNGITLTGTVTSSGSLTLGGTLSGIGNSQLTNSTISGVALGGNLFNLTAGTGVSFSAGTTYNGSAAITINATGTGGTVTSVAALTLGTTGTDLSSTVANGTTTPVITLNVPTASATNRGALSSTDWSTFNGKQAALVSGTNIKTVGGVSLLGSGDVGTIGATYGGTGQSSYAVGDLLYASSTTALSKLADVATGNALISGGVGVAPSYGKIGLTTHVSGTLPTANGGTNLTSFTANGIVYASSTSALATGSGLTFDGTNFATTGYASATSFRPTSSTVPTNGLYLPGTNILGWATNSTARMQIDASGIVSVNGTAQIVVAQFGVYGASGVGQGVIGAVNTNASTKKWQIGPDANGNFLVFNDAGTGMYMGYGATSWTANSDIRLKDNLAPITDAAAKVASIRAVTGKYKTDAKDVSRSFLIAQDVLAVLPEAVDIQEDTQKTLGLRYTDVIPLLVAAIAELKTEIDILKGQK